LESRDGRADAEYGRDVAPSPEARAIEFIRAELAATAPSDRRRLIEAVLVAALGSIPWVGGFLAAAAAYKSQGDEMKKDGLQTQWLEEHARKIAQLMLTLREVTERLESLGPAIDERIQSPEYLTLVRRSFRTWDRADTDEKRTYVRNLISNAAGTRLCSDDVVRLFLDWLDQYHEAHFAVIREIYHNAGMTRYDVWTAIYGELPREDSAEADLFRLLFRDLSTGGVIRQERETNLQGQFLRKRPQPRRRGTLASTMESAFEETKPYVLTGLGQQFVHYTMTETVRRIDAGGTASR
jgi:hypothetical protein